jgi:hypothetical protein
MAHDLLQKNDPAAALKIALEGLKHFPDYATGILVAAEAHLMLRHFGEARQLLLQLLRSIPACRAAKLLLDRIAELELEYPSPLEPESPSSQFLSSGEDWLPRNKRRNWSKADELIPGLSPPTAPASFIRDGKNADITERRQTSELERLAVRLENARIPMITDEAQSPFQDGSDYLEKIPNDNPLHPVTETMAVIFIQQRKYDAAIKVYRELCALHPSQETEYILKIEELGKQRCVE